MCTGTSIQETECGNQKGTPALPWSTGWWNTGKVKGSFSKEASSKELRKAAIQETYQLTGQYAKDSDEVKHLLNESIVQSINKELRKEKKTQSR